MTTFKSLGLAEPLIRGLLETGYTTPTPIQAAAIPAALTGADLTGCAQTGTGKTAAFVLPMLDQLLPAPTRLQDRPVRALVVTPTRELALQVEESVRTYGRFTGLRSVAVFGGVSQGKQVSAFRRGVDIVIATPGRLLDHLQQRNLDLSEVEILVLDEADRMFDMGFIKDVRRIVAAVPKKRQTLLFSATMPHAIQQLAASIQYKPTMIEVGQRTNTAKTVTQRFYRVHPKQKTDLLLHILDAEPVESVLVFSRTKHRANRIAKQLANEGVSSAAIHGNRTQNQRQRALADFKSGDVQVLVATDIAARGIDVDGISHVINYDTPNLAEDYIHRIGRTGRAQATGEALTFVAADEEPYVRTIEKVTGQRISKDRYPGFEHTTVVETEADNTTRQKPRGGGRGHSQGGGSSRNGGGRSSGGRNSRRR